jgi:hypothetical protein
MAVLIFVVTAHNVFHTSTNGNDRALPSIFNLHIYYDHSDQPLRLERVSTREHRS